jgi:hypothetical protein
VGSRSDPEGACLTRADAPGSSPLAPALVC